MKKGEIISGSLSGVSFLAALDAYVGTGTSSWLADICFSGDAPPEMIEGMPMENHSKHAAYFASAGLTFLAAALGWEFAETQVGKLQRQDPQGTERKRILSCIIYVATAAKCANKNVIDSAFRSVTGFDLEPTEAKEAFAFLMRDNAPDLHRILAGADAKERQRLLRAVVQAWSMHGLDSAQSTAVTERIVTLLGFDQDDICTTLDRLWLKDQARKSLRVSCAATQSGVQKACRTAFAVTKIVGKLLGSYLRRAGAGIVVGISR
jgi:hypothetical protein